MSHTDSPIPPKDQSITRQPEGALAPEDHSVRMVIRRALKSRLAQIGLVIAAAKPTAQVIYWCIDFYGNMQTAGELYATFLTPVFGFINKVIDFLGTGWGTAALMAVGFGLIALQLYLQHRRTHQALKSSGGSAEQTLAEKEDDVSAEERVYEDLSPAYLVGVFEREPLSVAEATVEKWVGKWVKYSARVGDVQEHSDGTFTPLTFSIDDPWRDGSTLVQVRTRWADEAAIRRPTIKTGDKVTIVGQIHRVDKLRVHLSNCEIIMPTIMELSARERLAPIDPARPVHLAPEYFKELFQKYESRPNEMRQETKAWDRRWVEITGEFAGVVHRTDDVWLVDLRAGHLPKDTQLLILKDDIPHVSIFKVGDRVKAKGVVMNFSYHSLVLGDCVMTYAS